MSCNKDFKLFFVYIFSPQWENLYNRKGGNIKAFTTIEFKSLKNPIIECIYKMLFVYIESNDFRCVGKCKKLNFNTDVNHLESSKSFGIDNQFKF